MSLGDHEFLEAARYFAPDIVPLMRASSAVRASVAARVREPDGRIVHRRLLSERSQAAFRELLDNVRLELRVAIEPVAGGDLPRDVRQVRAYMEAPAFLRTRHYRLLQSEVDREGVDPRLLCTVDRAIALAAGERIPLWPSALLTVSGDGEVFGSHAALPAAKPGASCQIGHCVLRQLPWSCWRLVSELVAEAGRRTGYPLVPHPVMPGEFDLADGARPWEPVDDPIAETFDGPLSAGSWSGGRSLSAKRLERGEAFAEREALGAFYAGGRWNPPDRSVAGNGQPGGGHD